MNHRKVHRKKQVRCTMCTPYKWMGNTKERTKAKYRETERRQVELES